MDSQDVAEVIDTAIQDERARRLAQQRAIEDRLLALENRLDALARRVEHFATLDHVLAGIHVRIDGNETSIDALRRRAQSTDAREQ